VFDGYQRWVRAYIEAFAFLTTVSLVPALFATLVSA